jgi:hypothetical protein
MGGAVCVELRAVRRARITGKPVTSSLASAPEPAER